MPNNIKRKKYKMFIDEEDFESGVYAISLVESPAIEENWVYLSKHYQVKLQEANGDKRLLIGPVLIPNKEIPRYDPETGEEYDIVFDEAVIEKAAQLFLQRQYNNKSTLEHETPLEDISVVESWIVADPKADKSNAYGMEYPRGSWIVMAKVNNEEIWKDYVKTGKVKGFSLEGLFGHNLVEASKQTKPVDLSALQDEADLEFAEEMLASIKGVIQKDGRYTNGQYVDLQTYSDYPEAVSNNAKRGIDANERLGNRCATLVGKVRAQQLAQGKPISLQTIKRMYSYLSRAETYYNPDDLTACGTVSYLLWGGDAAKRWSASKLKELGVIEAETAVSVASSYAGQWGNGRVGRHGIKPEYKNVVAAQYVSAPATEEDKKRFPGNRGVMHFPLPTEMQEGCPPATLDVELNLKNRQHAIDTANYGPLNPNEPNEEYWQKKADMFQGDLEAAKKALCANCAFFDVRKQTLACIAEGIGQEDDPELVIEAGDLGYCEAFDFKCASGRTCDAWVAGGPISDENLGMYYTNRPIGNDYAAGIPPISD